MEDNFYLKNFKSITEKHLKKIDKNLLLQILNLYNFINDKNINEKINEMIIKTEKNEQIVKHVEFSLNSINKELRKPILIEEIKNEALFLDVYTNYAYLHIVNKLFLENETLSYLKKITERAKRIFINKNGTYFLTSIDNKNLFLFEKLISFINSEKCIEKKTKIKIIFLEKNLNFKNNFETFNFKNKNSKTFINVKDFTNLNRAALLKIINLYSFLKKKNIIDSIIQDLKENKNTKKEKLIKISIIKINQKIFKPFFIKEIKTNGIEIKEYLLYADVKIYKKELMCRGDWIILEELARKTEKIEIYENNKSVYKIEKKNKINDFINYVNFNNLEKKKIKFKFKTGS